MRVELQAATAAAALLVAAAAAPSPLVAQTATQTDEAPLSETQAPAEAETAPLPPDDGAAGEAMTDEAPAQGEAAEAPVESTAPDAGGMIVVEQPRKSWMSDEVVGASVFNVSGERIGEVESLVFDESGLIAAVIGVGGFLGIGEKEVGVDWSAMTPIDDGYAIGATGDQLADAPAFATQEELMEKAEREARRAEAEAASTEAEKAARRLAE